MNYNSIEEILSSGITNMEVLRNNSKQDDGVDTINGVEWFSFNGVIASNVYASGNSFLGFGSSTEHLKVNGIDGALYSLYREEGTLYGYYKFLKIRWDGYSYYSATTSAYSLVYDVILWDTGDISLHMVNIPTSNNGGVYSLTASSTYTYSVSADSKDVTFIKTDSGFTVSNSVIDLIPPFEKRFLIRSGADYYTVVDNSLSAITVSDLTSSVFLTSGMQDMPNLSILSSLSNPELLYWAEKDHGALSSGLVVTGSPALPQVIYYEPQTIADGTSINKAEVYANGHVLFAVTFDDGQTWKYYDGTNWMVAASTSDGMTANVIKNLTPEKWAAIVSSSTCQFRGALMNTESEAGKMYLNIV